MTRLTWGLDGEKFFETGIDRVVLYLPNQIGVPWNGLRSIRESPSGGEPQPFYLDGLKYANVSIAEEFNATLEAYSSPPEFSVCDGSRQIAAGLFVTQQPRSSFGLSYRTGVGNDISGVDGYKIHLIYNAMAAPSGRDNSSASNTVSPLGLSWNISTRPPLGTGYKPTAHLVIDSRYTAIEVLDRLEVLLYGDEDVNAILPTQEEIISIFTEYTPVEPEPEEETDG